MSLQKTLILNQGYQPFEITSWQHAFSLLFRGKVEVVSTYSNTKIRSAHQTFDMPAVVRTKVYQRKKSRLTKFCRDNIFIRDEYRCQYCGKSAVKNKLTFDHVIPKSRGGLTNWTNIVTACNKCNSKKADRLPDEANMKLLRQPMEPSGKLIHHIFARSQAIPNEWSNWLSVNT